MKNTIRFLMVTVLAVVLTGCAGIDIPKTTDVIKEPLGKGALQLGMTKSQVSNIYGEPDYKRNVYSRKWKEPREEWFYSARYPVIPVNAGYLSEDLYLYFDGENLTDISKKPIGTEVKEKPDENYIK